MYQVWLGLKCHFRLKHETLQCMPLAVYIKIWEFIWFPNLNQKFYNSVMYKNVSENQTSVKWFVKTTFVWTLWEYAGKAVWVNKMCEHLRMVKNLNFLFPETITVSENMLESLSNSSGIGRRCWKPEIIRKLIEINNLAIANEK